MDEWCAGGRVKHTSWRVDLTRITELCVADSDGCETKVHANVPVPRKSPVVSHVRRMFMVSCRCHHPYDDPCLLPSIPIRKCPSYSKATFPLTATPIEADAALDVALSEDDDSKVGIVNTTIHEIQNSHTYPGDSTYFHPELSAPDDRQCE
ncbi:hypothetical protein A0H81_09265 [Grifola frondosa]|uniref:Uncharacterized protein n=1 Tax=Grifola frondosa TaxID=5627 RepID=A0A1C7M1L2_GRIFR|nr:hypothetical protein A0H81_09265 [Grifola frondosa]